MQGPNSIVELLGQISKEGLVKWVAFHVRLGKVPTIQKVYELHRSEHPVINEELGTTRAEGQSSLPIDRPGASNCRGESPLPLDVRLAAAGLSPKLYVHQVPELSALIEGVETIRL